MSAPAYTRRRALGLAIAGCACAVCGANAATLSYELKATEIAPGTYAVIGAPEYFSFGNGGAIVNTAFVAVPDGVVVVDTGPSRRYGEALAGLIEATLPGRRIVRVFNTHHHPDHFLGNQAFDPAVVAAPQGVIDNIATEGNGFADNMYRLLGDWMRGTAPVAPAVAVSGEGEDVGGRRFAYLLLDGHTSADFALRDEETGVLFTGDLCFLDRAPTTPHADLVRWHEALGVIAASDSAILLPGHGPADARGRSVEQTRDYLAWLDGTVRQAVSSGLTMNEAMDLAIPARFAALGVVRGEYQRSVVHLWERLEDEIYPEVEVSR